VNHFFSETADKKLAAKAMGTLLMTLRGTPFLYQGQELGLENIAWPSIDCYNDISSHGQYAFALSEGLSEEEALACVHEFSRDSARTPMQWNAEKNAGFTSGKPWLPVHDDYESVNVEVQEKDADSVLNWFRKLAEIRKEYPVLETGDFEEILTDDPDLIGYIRKEGEESLCVLINLSDAHALFTCKEAENRELLLSNYSTYEKGSLAPLQCVILR
jgi:alpha-glucosidase